MKGRYVWRNWRRNKGTITRRRHRKKTWDGHFYIQACSYIQTCLTHNCSFTQRQYHTHTLSHSHTDAIPTNTFTHKDVFTNNFAHNPFYTPMLLHTDTLAHTHNAFTQTLLRAYPFTHKHFYTNAFTHRTLYTHTHPFHTHKHVYLAMLRMECHFEPLFGWVMLLQPKKECHGILHAEKQSASLFCRHRFKMSTLCTSKSQTDPIDLFCTISCLHTANWWSKGSMCINKSQTVSVDLSAAVSHSNAKKEMPHKHFYTESFYTQTLLHTNAFTHKRFYTQTLSRTIPFYTHNRLYPQECLHTNNACAQKHF